MRIETELRKVPFDDKLKENIDKFSNSPELINYKLVSSFLTPEINKQVYVVLIFQTEWHGRL